MRGKKPAAKKKPQPARRYEPLASAPAESFPVFLQEFRSLLFSLRLGLLDLQNISRHFERRIIMTESTAVATAPDQPQPDSPPEEKKELSPGDLLKTALAEFEAHTHFGEYQQQLFLRIKGMVYQRDPGPLCVWYEGITEPLPPPTPEERKALEDATTPPEAEQQKLLAEGEANAEEANAEASGGEAANAETGSSAEAGGSRRRRREQAAEGEQKTE